MAFDRSVVIVSLTLLGVTLLNVEVRPQTVQTPVREAAQRFITAHGRAWQVTIDARSDTVKRLRGGYSRPFPGTPEQATREFLLENRELFQIDSDLADLVLYSASGSSGDTHLTFNQFYSGLPVIDAGMSVDLTDDGRVFLVQNRYVPISRLAAVTVPPSVLADDAAAIALQDARHTTVRGKRGDPVALPYVNVIGTPELVIAAAETDYRLAWRVIVSGLEYAIDGLSGSILHKRQFVKFVTGTGRVFDPNPVVTTGDTTLRDRKDKNYAALDPAYFTVELQDITVDAGVYKLVGPYVDTRDLKTKELTAHPCEPDPDEEPFVRVRLPPPTIPVTGAPDFLYSRARPGFEHTMVYYHIDRNQRYMQELGFTINKRPIVVDAHAMKADQSYYCDRPLGLGFLAFGDGGVDDAEDADIILHEYGHAIQDNEAPGAYPAEGEAGAMGEGFGDYWAFSNRTNLSFDPACFAAWDFEGEGGCLRRLDRDKHYPEHCVGGIHACGEIWSAALYEIFNKTDKRTSDTLVLKSHMYVPMNPSFVEGAEALLFADKRIYGGTHREVICKAISARGIFPLSCFSGSGPR